MKSPKNTIWILLDSRKPGGIESHTFELAKGLVRFGKRVVVVFLNNYGHHPLRSLLISQGISTISLDGSFFSLYKKANQKKPAIIHTHGYKAGIYGRIVATTLDIPVVSTYHAGEISKGKLAIYTWLDRSTAALADKVYTVSKSIKENIPTKSEIVNNFIDTRNIKESHGNQISFVGRLSQEKGPDIFVKLASMFPRHHFHIYGDGPCIKELQSNATPNVVFHGQKNTMSDHWKNIGLLVMPSRHEGMPLAALEAMAHGIPVIASDVGALSQLIEHGENGWINQPGNIEETRKLIFYWLTMSPDNQNKIKTEARYTINANFSQEKVIPKLIKQYHKLSHQL